MALLLSCNDHYDEIKEAHDGLERQHAEIYGYAEQLAALGDDGDSVSQKEVIELAEEIMSIIECDTIETILDDVISDLVK